MRHQVAIEISGVCAADGTPYRWYAEPPLNQTNTTRSNAILGLGAFSSSVAEGESVAQSAVTSITLAADDMTAIGQRPMDIFGRVGAENLSSSQVWATLGQTAGQQTITIERTTGAAQIPSGTFLHIGTEMIQTTATWTPTGVQSVACIRGCGGTIPRPHRASLSGYFARSIPVTLVPTEWVGRQVTIFVDGAVWRVGFLVDNPSISATQVVLSYVSAENLLSVDKSGDYVPPYGTTLAPVTIGINYHRNWFLWTSLPAIKYSLPASAVDEYRDKETVLEDDFTFLGFDAKTKITNLTYWYDQVVLGQSSYPNTYVTFCRLPYLQGSGQTGDLEYRIQIDYAGYLADDPTSCDMNFSLRNDSAYQAMQLCTSSGSTWYVSGFDTGAYTAPSGGIYPKSGEHTANYGESSAYGTNYEAFETFAYRLEPNSVAVTSQICPQRGYRITLQGGLFVGVLSRRNTYPGETILAESQDNQLFSGLPPMLPWPGQYTRTTIPCNPDQPQPLMSFYNVRPREDGTVHNQIGYKGCVLTLDMWAVDQSLTDFNLPCDVATTFWEIGQTRIWTVATLPGLITDGSSGMVSISWQEPDGTDMTATANLYRRESADQSSYYAYDISDVSTPDGKKCVGFGNWPQKRQCTISRPVGARGSLGGLLAAAIASSDGSSGRIHDEFADGLGCPLTTPGALSLESITTGTIPSHWAFYPEKTSYSDFLRMATQVSGVMLVGRQSDVQTDVWQYGPVAVPAGRPSAWEAVDSWSDADFIGLPVSSGDKGLIYTGYKVTAGDRTVNTPDWLAADLFGQGETCEIDLTDIYTRHKLITEETIYGLTDSLHDRYGTARRRWSVTMPLDKTIKRGVGDVIAVTSKYLISADGHIGVTAALARIMSISHDFTQGKSEIEMIAYASYGAGYAQSWDMTVTAVSGTSYTFEFNTSEDPVTAARQIYDRLHFSPQAINSSSSDNIYLACGIGGVASGGYLYGYFTSWAPSAAGGTAVMTRQGYSNPTPAVGTRCLVVKGYNSAVPAAMADAFKKGTSRLL